MNPRDQIADYLCGRVGTSLLLTGLRGLPMRDDAEMVAAQLLNVGLDGLSGHPDYLVFTAEKGKQLGVDEALSIVEKAGRKPAVAEKTVVLVDGFDSFNTAAQNKLLKLIEDSSTVIILGVSYSENVLPTIRSRCQVVEYHPYAKKEFLSECEKRGIGDAETLYYVTQGVSFEAEPEVIGVFRSLEKAVIEGDVRGILSALHLVKEKDTENFFISHREYVGVLCSYFSRLLMKKGIEPPPALEKGVLEYSRSTYTKDDFFFAVATGCNLLKTC